MAIALSEKWCWKNVLSPKERNLKRTKTTIFRGIMPFFVNIKWLVIFPGEFVQRWFIDRYRPTLMKTSFSMHLYICRDLGGSWLRLILLSDSCKEVSQILLYIDVENEQPKTKQTSLWPYNLKPNGIHKITLITDGVGKVDRMEDLNASTIWFHASDEPLIDFRLPHIRFCQWRSWSDCHDCA